MLKFEFPPFSPQPIFIFLSSAAFFLLREKLSCKIKLCAKKGRMEVKKCKRREKDEEENLCFIKFLDCALFFRQPFFFRNCRLSRKIDRATRSLKLKKIS